MSFVYSHILCKTAAAVAIVETSSNSVLILAKFDLVQEDPPKFASICPLSGQMHFQLKHELEKILCCKTHGDLVDKDVEEKVELTTW